MSRRKRAARSGIFRSVVGVSSAAAALYGVGAYGLNYELPLMGDSVKTTLNSTITIGAGMRMQGQSVNQIGKADLNPNVCGLGPYSTSVPATRMEWQSCQGVFQDQGFLAGHLAHSPGAASLNTDEGDLNYNKGEFFSGLVKVSEDFKADWKDYGVFGRALWFHDAVNNNFTEYHPNLITPDSQGFTSVANPADPNKNVLGTPIGLPSLRLPYVGGRVFGPGDVVRPHRSDNDVLNEVGDSIQFLDAYAHGKVPLWGDRELSIKAGRMTLNWGESTTIVSNSINNINPVDLNNVYRIGGQVEEFFIPTNMVDLSFQPIDNTTVEGYYQLEWQPDIIAAPGSYFSTVNVGSKNDVNNLNISFGQTAQDPQRLGILAYNPLSTIAPSTATILRQPDLEPKTSGQFGVKIDHYFENFNNGTDVALYLENYASRLPYVSFYAANPSCARMAGSATHTDATHLGLLAAGSDQSAMWNTCPGLPMLAGNVQTDFSALQADSARFQLSYPDNIHLIGASFNTTFGAWSLQGEIAYRPNMPLQVDEHDLLFAALGPTLTNCGNGSTNCVGSAFSGSPTGPFGLDLQGLGYGEGPNGTFVKYPNNDVGLKSGSTTDTYGLISGVIPGVQRAFPNFVIPYRGGQIGQNPGCFSQVQINGDPSNTRFSGGVPGAAGVNYASQYQQGSNCWIQGWERFQVYQFNLGTTRVFGATENWFKADQIQLVGEAGATYVPFMPSLDRLQLQAPGVTYAASAGADGSGANGSAQACSTNADCVVAQAGNPSSGQDALRFNPHQQDLTGYPDPISWGYRLIAIFKYESVLPGISLQPTVFYSQDVQGTSPGPGENFVAGRKSTNFMLETRYKSWMSFTTGYTWYWGGGQYNTLSDRDFLQFFLKFQF